MKKLILAVFLVAVTAGILVFSGCGNDKKGKTAAANYNTSSSNASAQRLAVRSSARAVPTRWNLRRGPVIASASSSSDSLGKSRTRLHQEVRESLGSSRHYVRPARAEIHSDLLSREPVAYSTPARKPAGRYLTAPMPKRMNSSFDFEGPELGSDLDGPGFVPCRASISTSKRATLISKRADRVRKNVKKPLNISQGPELGWLASRNETF